MIGLNSHVTLPRLRFFSRVVQTNHVQTNHHDRRLLTTTQQPTQHTTLERHQQMLTGRATQRQKTQEKKGIKGKTTPRPDQYTRPHQTRQDQSLFWTCGIHFCFCKSVLVPVFFFSLLQQYWSHDTPWYLALGSIDKRFTRLLPCLTSSMAWKSCTTLLRPRLENLWKLGATPLCTWSSPTLFLWSTLFVRSWCSMSVKTLTSFDKRLNFIRQLMASNTVCCLCLALSCLVFYLFLSLSFVLGNVYVYDYVLSMSMSCLQKAISKRKQVLFSLLNHDGYFFASTLSLSWCFNKNASFESAYFI